jgi:hypothetical protein
MTSIFGAFLTAGYAAAMGTAISDSGQDVTATTQSMLQLSYASAADMASQYPQYANEILAAAKSSFLDGDQLTYIAGFVAVLIGLSVTFFLFPRKDREAQLHAEYHAEDEGAAAPESPAEPSPVPAPQGA